MSHFDRDKHASVGRLGIRLAFPALACGLIIACAALQSSSRGAMAQPAPASQIVAADQLLLDVRDHFLQGQFRAGVERAEAALLAIGLAYGEESPQMADLLNNLALLYENVGRYDDAESQYLRALELREALFPAPSPEVAESLNNLAELLVTVGRYGEAETLHRRALTMRLELDQQPGLEESLNNLGDLIRVQVAGQVAFLEGPTMPADLQDRLAEAGRLLGEALVLIEGEFGEGTLQTTPTMTNLGLLHMLAGSYDTAFELLVEALSIRRANLPPGHYQIAVSLTDLASLYDSIGSFADAFPLHQEAIEIASAALGDTHPTVAIMLGNLSAHFRFQNRWLEARDHIGRAVEIFSLPQNRVHIPANENFFVLLSVYDVLIAQNGGPIAELRADAFLWHQWRARVSAGRAIAEATARSSQTDPELRELVRRRDELLEATNALENALLVAIQQLGAPEGVPLGQLRDQLASVANEIATITAVLDERFAPYAALSEPTPIPVAEVQRLLGPDEVLVTFVLSESEGLVFAVTPTEIAWGSVPWISYFRDPMNELLRAAAGGSNSAIQVGRGTLIPYDAGAFDLNIAYGLYTLLLGPVADIIERRSLLIVPDPAIAGFPFQLLVQSPPVAGLTGNDAYRQADWLIRSHAIAVLPTVSSLRALRGVEPGQAEAGKAMIAFADPVLDRATAPTDCGDARQLEDGFPAVRADWLFADAGGDAQFALADPDAIRTLAPLPETRCEAEAIAARLGANPEDLLFGAAATETSVKSLNAVGRLEDYRLLLFATHGLLAGELGVAEPGLVLTPPEVATAVDDGILTAREVADLRLNAEWVILSACNTAAGDAAVGGETLSGLARSFLYAGARSVLVSHWPVDSDAAVAITTGAFAAMAVDPDLSRAEAMRRSVLAFMDGGPPGNAHPRRWAPFSLVGDGL